MDCILRVAFVSIAKHSCTQKILLDKLSLLDLALSAPSDQNNQNTR